MKKLEVLTSRVTLMHNKLGLFFFNEEHLLMNVDRAD